MLLQSQTLAAILFFLLCSFSAGRLREALKLFPSVVSGGSNSPLQLGKIGKKFIKFLNFCQIRLEPPENENQKVPSAKG